jgi:uncharacterized membrane protein
MALWRSRLIGAFGAAALVLPSNLARAGTGDITFCNDFPHKLFIALAYIQTDVNNYLSRGWLEVDTGKCYVFDTAIRVPTFYYRAESEPYKDGKHKVKTWWGDEKKFAVKDSHCQAYNAEKVYSGMHLAGFNKGPASTGAPVTASVTFTATGGSNITVPAPETSSGGGAASPPAERAAAPDTGSSPAQLGGIEDKSDGPDPSAATLTPPASGGSSEGNGRDSGPRQ